MMSVINENMQTTELMKIAADYSQQRIGLTDDEKSLLVQLLKQHAQDELEFGQEIEWETVRVVRRVTGAISVFFK